MIVHVVGIISVIALAVLCTILPFLPGRYDPLAPLVWLMAQVFALAGLLLVPVAALWLVTEYRNPSARTRYAVAIVTLSVGSLAWLAMALGAMTQSVILGILIILLGIYLLTRLVPSLGTLTSTATHGTRAVPFFLLVPLVVFLIQRAVAEPLTEFSRNRAIRNSAAIIADIERYRATNGRYPPSTVALHKDYHPSLVGIREYVYEPSGNAYNLLFEQLSFRVGTREIVVYNPLGQNAMTSHALDKLQLTPEQLLVEQTRGHNEAHAAPQKGWKYFWFD